MIDAMRDAKRPRDYRVEKKSFELMACGTDHCCMFLRHRGREKGAGFGGSIPIVVHAPVSSLRRLSDVD
jgi:hypothetical protein